MTMRAVVTVLVGALLTVPLAFPMPVTVPMPAAVVPAAGSAAAPAAVAAAVAAAPADAVSGPLQPPLRPPTVLVPFTAPPDRYGAGHRGVDLAAAAGAEVLAPADGVVVFAGRLVDRGVVSIDHGGGLRTSLEPVTASVVAGARVAAGQVVGRVDGGHPRCAPAVCLHWGVRLDGAYLDPMTLLAPVRVRLLPWDR